MVPWSSDTTENNHKPSKTHSSSVFLNHVTLPLINIQHGHLRQPKKRLYNFSLRCIISILICSIGMYIQHPEKASQCFILIPQKQDHSHKVQSESFRFSSQAHTSKISREMGHIYKDKYYDHILKQSHALVR